MILDHANLILEDSLLFRASVVLSLISHAIEIRQRLPYLDRLVEDIPGSDWLLLYSWWAMIGRLNRFVVPLAYRIEELLARIKALVNLANIEETG